MKVEKVPNDWKKLSGTNFLVTVYSNENQNLQGLIHWLDTGKKVHFRSVIELIELLNEASRIQNHVSVTKRTWLAASFEGELKPMI